jgi:RecJ-like exonuclease
MTTTQTPNTTAEARDIKCTKCHGKGRILNDKQDDGRCWSCDATGYITATERAAVTTRNARFNAERVQMRRLLDFACSIEKIDEDVSRGLICFTALLGAAMVDILNGSEVNPKAAQIIQRVAEMTGHDLAEFTLAS